MEFVRFNWNTTEDEQSSHCPAHPTIWSWIRYIQEAEESVMIRLEQEHAQQRTTRPKRLTTVNNENILVQAKEDYLNGLLDLDGYQKRLRSLCYRYIRVLDTSDKDDENYEPKHS